MTDSQTINIAESIPPKIKPQTIKTGPSKIIEYAFAVAISAIILAMATVLCIRLVVWAIG